jgi:hypothetical protein
MFSHFDRDSETLLSMDSLAPESLPLLAMTPVLTFCDL